MRRVTLPLAFVVLALFTTPALHAQSPASSAAVPAVPRVVRLTGTFVPANSLAPSPVETVTLAIYADETGGVPLWQETQYVTLDAAGRYAVLLGATQPEGLPVDLFASGEARWLGRRFERAGEPEQARVLLASVPYALKAANADTLGGLPPSAYQLAAPTVGVSTASALAPTTTSGAGAAQAAAAQPPQALTSGTAACVAAFTNTTDLGCSPMVHSGGAVGLGTATPFDRFHVRFTNTNGAFTGYAVQNLGNTATSYSGMLFYDQNGALGQFQGFNNSTHEYRINNIASGGSINFMLGGSSKFRVDAYGVATADPLSAPRFTTTGPAGNTVVGSGALRDNTPDQGACSDPNCPLAGFSNTAIGEDALLLNTTGYANTAIGSGYPSDVLVDGVLWDDPPAPLVHNGTGHGNTAVGFAALWDNTTGNNNTAIGYRAGPSAYQSNDGSNNIYLGANAGWGTHHESNAIYLGQQGTQTKAVIAGIRGITTAVADAIPVMIDSQGQLGTISSSRRFKEDIHDMGEASRALFALRPVTFRYSKPYTNGAKPIHYGLVAEEVAEVFPDLAVRNADGGVDTVHYETLSVLLLNELQKQRLDMKAQQRRIEALERRLEALTTAE